MSFSLLASPLKRSTASTSIIVNSFASPIVIQQRTATKRGAGSTRNNKDSAGRRLGLKKSGGQQVIPGNIIVRQRGFEWHPGQHVGAGKDHTLFALEPGFVQFYKTLKKPGSTSTSPKMMRKYCGITLTRDEKLPRDEATLGRSRRFGQTNLTRVEAALEGFKQAREEMRSSSDTSSGKIEKQQIVVDV